MNMSLSCAKSDVDQRSVIHHVVLIGFHHKKGCIIEYCYPPLRQDNGELCDPTSSFLPAKWQALPSLAMPDGAHNFSEDMVYFHLPSLVCEGSGGAYGETVYCVSYCRQVDANQLVKKDEQVTRGTVQKSVVVLSKAPAFGLIHTKLQLPLITNAFLENFSEKSVLVELYNQLTTSLHITDESQYFFGLECRGLVLQFRRKLLSLFKLILLERRIIFYSTRASSLVNTVFSLLSLYPRMIECGLSHATDERSVVVKNTVAESQPDDMASDPESSEMSKVKSSNSEPPLAQSISRSTTTGEITDKLPRSSVTSEEDNKFEILEVDDDEYVLNLENARLEMTVGSPEKIAKSKDTLEEDPACDLSLLPSPIAADKQGHPLCVFTNGHMCLPYISLQQHGLLKSNPENGYLVGATNILFATQRDLCDVIINVSEGTVTYNDSRLESLLSLSPADLRFMDHVMSNTMQENDNYFNRAAEWKGGDEWMRGLFAEYVNRMLCAVGNKSSESRNLQDFNESFVREWRKTKNFRTWFNAHHDSIDDAHSQHLFHGQFSISDVRLRLHHKLQDSEQGRKFEDALSNANDTLVNTGRYLGSALGSAKSWFSNKIHSRKNSNPEN